MDAYLARMLYTYTATAFTPHGYTGTFYSPDDGLFHVMSVTSGTLLAQAALETLFETTFPTVSFDWNVAAPPF